jgi:hypothetical protein
VSNTGLADINSKITSAGTVLFDSTGGINLGADIETTAASAAITVNDSVVTVDANARLETNDGDITLDEVQDDTNSRNLELAAGTGNILIDDNVGVNGGATLGLLNIESADDVHFSGTAATVDVDQLTIGSVSAIGNDVEFDGSVNVGGNVDIDTNTLTLDASLTTASGGTVTVSNTGLADINAKITSAGTVLFDSTGAINLGGDIETTAASAAITVNDSVVTVDANARLITNNGNITLDEVLDDTNSRNLELVAGTGNVLIDDNVGVNGGATLALLDIESAGDVLFSTSAATVDVDQLTIGSVTAIGNDVEFNGAVTTTGAIDVSAATINVDAQLTTTGGAGGTVDLSGASTLSAGITTDGGAVTLDTGAVTVDTNLTIDTTNANNTPAGGNITLETALNADTGATHNLVLDAGSGGTIDINANVGTTTSLLSFTVEDAGAVNLLAVTVDGGDITVGNTDPVNLITVDGVLTTLGAGPGGQLTINGGGIVLNATPVLGDTDITIL